MEKELRDFMELQNKVNKETTNAIELLIKNVDTMNERIKVAHDRMDKQGEYIDKLFSMVKDLQEDIIVIQECTQNRG